MREQTYWLHNLHLRTTLPLAPCPVSAAEADVVASYVEVPGPAIRPSAVFSTAWRGTEDGGTLTYQGVEGDRLDLLLGGAGTRVDIRCTVPQSAAAVARIFLGPGMAALLALRGAVVLHGGAVVIDGCAALILGASGTGKSTLVAAMVAAGSPFLTEEVAAIVPGARGLEVLPGYPRIGLTRESMAAVATPADRPMVLPGLEEKHWLDVTELVGGSSAARPVGAVYVLSDQARADRSSISQLTPSRAAAAVLRHLYGAGWLLQDHRRCLGAITSLVKDVPVFEVSLAGGLDRIRDAAAFVTAHAQSRIFAL